MKWFLILNGIFISSISFALEFTVDTSPRILGSAKVNAGVYTQFACYKGSIMETRGSRPGSFFDNVKIETKDEDVNLKVGEVKITISGFSSKSVQRDLYAPYLDEKFKNDSRCQNDIFLGYEMAGAIRLSKTFRVAQEDVKQLKEILNKVRNLEDFYDLDVSAINSLTGWSVGFGASDHRLNVSVLFDTSSREQFLNTANELLKTLDSLYPVERVNNMAFDPSSLVYVRTGRP